MGNVIPEEKEMESQGSDLLTTPAQLWFEAMDNPYEIRIWCKPEITKKCHAFAKVTLEKFSNLKEVVRWASPPPYFLRRERIDGIKSEKFNTQEHAEEMNGRKYK